MTVTLPVIAALLLILPGIGFIVGVNLADKNVREIVFRNAPAEFGYVIIVSLVAHLIFAWAFKSFNVAEVIVRYEALVPLEHGAKLSDPDEPQKLLVHSLFYFFCATVAGFAMGFFLGRAIRYFKLSFFTKHRWMLDLVGIRAGDYVYARVLLSPHFPGDGKPGVRSIAVEGFLSDSFFDANGTLLYLVFRNFRETTVRLSTPPYVGRFASAPDGVNAVFENDRSRVSSVGLADRLLRVMSRVPLLARFVRRRHSQVDHLVIEGRWIEIARYYPLAGRKLRGQLQELERRADEDLEAIETAEP
jgi:hypothetical protein